MTRPAPKDLYTILNLPPTTSTTTTTTTPTPLTKQHLKTAYHKALLKHHPDKTPGSDTPPNTTTTPSPPNETYTIDEITSAYKTLSDPALRAEYDRELRLDRARVAQREKNGTVFHTGLEVVDLEDLGFEDGEGEGGDYWYRGCRCGDDKGFLVTEMDLEREAEHGEVVVGCRGCSLWMKVLFAVEE
ncbi:DnaJ-domain-containing protein, partial [Aspergillus ellipticus CBS 707.79]